MSFAYSIGGKSPKNGGHESNLWRIDLTNGLSTSLGVLDLGDPTLTTDINGNPLNLSGNQGDNLDIEGFEYNPVGDAFYAVIKSPGSKTDGLIKIELSADGNTIQHITYIGGNIATNILNLAGLTFSSNGTLYMTADSPNGGGKSGLYTVNLTTGNKTFLGDNTADLGSITFQVTPDGQGEKLYALGKEGNNTILYELDPNNGSITSSVQITGNSVVTSTQIEGLTSDSNGTLWAIDNKTGTLVTINPLTGVATTQVTANVAGTPLGNAGQTGDGLESLAIDVNRGPFADDDFATVNEDEMVTIDILDGDFDADGFIDPTTITIGTGTQNGSIVINPDGTVKYTPNPDFNGTDTFTYTVKDNDGATSNTATVTIVVNPVNDPPDAVNDSEDTNEDTSVTISVLSNDSDPDGDPLSVTGASNGANGTTTVNPDGTITYTPNANFNGTDTFTYDISDGNGGTDTATVTVNIDPVNDAPDAVDNSYSTDEDTGVGGHLITDNTGEGLDSDADGDTLTVTSNTNPNNGSVVVNPDGTFTYTPNANFNGTDTFTYTISDGNGGTDTATVNIAIAPVNDPPVAVNDVAYTELGDPVTINVVNNDSDSDGTINPSSTTRTSDPSGGTVGNNGDGTFTYTPTVPNIPDVDNSYADTFNYTVDDNDGLSSNSATVTVNVIDPGEQTNTNSVMLPNQQNVTLLLTTEERTANSTSFVRGRISLSNLIQPNFNIAYVIDISGSTGENFGGTVPGDQNGDGDNNDIIDAEIASFKALTNSILSTGFGNNEIDIGLISFELSATLKGTFEPADPNDPTMINPALNSALSSLVPAGYTNFDDALDKAIDFFNAQPDKNTATNILYFLSDGVPNVGGDGDGESGTGEFIGGGGNNPNAIKFASELATLNGLNVQRVAIGVGSGSSLSSLNLIDNTGGAVQVTSSNQLTDELLGSPIQGGTLIDFKLTVNGNDLDGNPIGELDIDVNDLISTPFGYEFGPFTVDGLNFSLGSNNTITAQVTFDQDGNPLTTGDQTILTVNNIITGALPT